MKLLNHNEINRNWEDMKKKLRDEGKEVRSIRMIDRIKKDMKHWEAIEREAKTESMIELERETLLKLNNRLEKRI